MSFHPFLSLPLSLCCVASQQALLTISPDGQLVGHHHFVISVGHQQPYGILQDALDELLLSTVPASATATPCWLFAGMVVLRGVDAAEVLAGVAALAAAWIGGEETELCLRQNVAVSSFFSNDWTDWCRWCRWSCSRWSRSRNQTILCQRNLSRRRRSPCLNASLPAASNPAGRLRWTWRPGWTRLFLPE